MVHKVATCDLKSLASPSATRGLLSEFGYSPKKAFGQNFLVDALILAKIIELADIHEDDCIFEVGPGIGTLTRELLRTGATVNAVERDHDMKRVLQETIGESPLFHLESGDALDIVRSGAAWLCRCNKMVSNLPYSIAATIVLDVFQSVQTIESATVMVQREVAERMCATPGSKDYGAYTVKLSLYAKPCGSFKVSPNCFFPPPHVDSTVIRLDRVDSELDPRVLRSAAQFADAAFFSRRKTLLNSSRAYFSARGMFSESELLQIFSVCDIDSKVRGEKLNVSDFISMAKAGIEIYSA